MSIDSKKICCTGCEFETREFYRPILIVYRLKNGKEIDTGRAKGWCFNCGDYVDIENLNLDQLREARIVKAREIENYQIRAGELTKRFLASLRNRAEKTDLQCSITRLDEEIQKLGDLIEVAAMRKSGARCLACWLDDTAPVTFDSQDNISHDFRHECGGRLIFLGEDSGMRLNFAITTYVLNEEGELLEER
jgi:hypothetical protein